MLEGPHEKVLWATADTPNIQDEYIIMSYMVMIYQSNANKDDH